MTHDDSDNIDIYSDLPSFNYVEKISKLEHHNKVLEEKIQGLQVSLSEALQEKEQLEEKCKNLSYNISSLLKTAQAEIVRKNKTITELREKFDNAVFRRRDYSKEETRSRDQRTSKTKRHASPSSRRRSSLESKRIKRSARCLSRERRRERSIIRENKAKSEKRKVKVNKTSEEKENITDNVPDGFPNSPEERLNEVVPEPSLPIPVCTEYSRRMLKRLQNSQKDAEKVLPAQEIPSLTHNPCCSNDLQDTTVPPCLKVTKPVNSFEINVETSKSIEDPPCEENFSQVKNISQREIKNANQFGEAETKRPCIDVNLINMLAEKKDLLHNFEKPAECNSEIMSESCDDVRNPSSLEDSNQVKEVEPGISECNEILDILKFDKAKDNIIPCELFSLESLESFQQTSHPSSNYFVNSQAHSTINKNEAILEPVIPSVKANPDKASVQEDKNLNTNFSSSMKSGIRSENNNKENNSEGKLMKKISTKKANKIGVPLITPISKKLLSTPTRFHNVALESVSKSPVKNVSSKSKLMESIFGSPLKWVDDEDCSKDGAAIINSASHCENKPADGCYSSEKVINLNGSQISVTESETLTDVNPISKNHCLTTTDTRTVNCTLVNKAIETKIQTSQIIKYDDSTLGQFEDTIQFVSALSVFKPRVSPIGTPEKSRESTELKGSFSPLNANHKPDPKNTECENFIDSSEVIINNKFTPLRISQKNKFKTNSTDKPVNILQPRKVPRKVTSTNLNKSPLSQQIKSNMRISCLDNKAIASVCHLVRAIKKDGCSGVREAKISPKKNKVRKDELCLANIVSSMSVQKSPCDLSSSSNVTSNCGGDNNKSSEFCSETNNISQKGKTEINSLSKQETCADDINKSKNKSIENSEMVINSESDIKCSLMQARKTKLIESLPQFKKGSNLTKTNIIMRKLNSTSKEQNMTLLKKFEESICSSGIRELNKVSYVKRNDHKNNSLVTESYSVSNNRAVDDTRRKRENRSPHFKSDDSTPSKGSKSYRNSSQNKQDSKENKNTRNCSPEFKSLESKSYKPRHTDKSSDSSRRDRYVRVKESKERRPPRRSKERKPSPLKRGAASHTRRSSYYLDKRMYFAERRGDKSYAQRREKSVLRDVSYKRKKYHSPVKNVECENSKWLPLETPVRVPSRDAGYDRIRGVVTPGIAWKLIEVDNVPESPTLKVEPHPEDFPPEANVGDKHLFSSNHIEISSPVSIKCVTPKKSINIKQRALVKSMSSGDPKLSK